MVVLCNTTVDVNSVCGIFLFILAILIPLGSNEVSPGDTLTCTKELSSPNPLTASNGFHETFAWTVLNINVNCASAVPFLGQVSVGFQRGISAGVQLATVDFQRGSQICRTKFSATLQQEKNQLI